MALRLFFIVVPVAAVVGLVLLLNGLDASAGIAAAVLGTVAVVSGAFVGYFADRLPALPRTRHAHPLAPHRID
jgi:hypothetical protein